MMLPPPPLAPMMVLRVPMPALPREERPTMPPPPGAAGKTAEALDLGALVGEITAGSLDLHERKAA